MWLVRCWLLLLLGLCLGNSYKLRPPTMGQTDVVDIKQAIELIKERTSISDIVSHYVSIKPAGAGQYQCKCPFHKDGNPSMGISDEKGVYNCFSCGAKGDAVQFVKDIEQLTFIDAVKRIISMADLNVETLNLVKRTDEELRYIAQRSRLELLLSKASQFYAIRLVSDNKAGIARRHLMSRRLRPGVAFKFGIGYAPLSNGGVGGLISNLTGEGFTLKEIINAGLAIDSDTFQQNVTNDMPRTSDKRHATVYDRFRDRLMIPIKNPQGAVIGFGGRTMQDLTNNINYDASKVPKYLNSPETMLFKKSSTLFGLDVARRAIGTERVAVFVEGYFDVISLHDIGVENAVGVLGTAITKEHLESAARASKDGIIVLLMDSDKAGQTAVERCCTQVLSQSDLGRLDVRIASFTSLLSHNATRNELVKDASDLCSLSSNRTETFALVKGVIDNAVGWKQWMAERIILRGVKPIASSSVMLMDNDDDMIQATDELRRDTASWSRVLKNLSIFIASLPDRADRTLLSYYCSEKLAGDNNGLKATLDVDLAQMIEAQANKFWGASKYDATAAGASSRTPIVNRSMLSAKPRGETDAKADQVRPAKDIADSERTRPTAPPPASSARGQPMTSFSASNTRSATAISGASTTSTPSVAAGVSRFPATGSVGPVASAPAAMASSNNNAYRSENRVATTAATTNTAPTSMAGSSSNAYRSENQVSTARATTAPAAMTGPSSNVYRSENQAVPARTSTAPAAMANNPSSNAYRNNRAATITNTPSVKKISVNITNAGGAASGNEVMDIDIDQITASITQSPAKRRAKYGSASQFQDPVIWQQTAYADSTLSSTSNIASRIIDAEALVLSAYCLLPSVRDIIDTYFNKENPHAWGDRMHAYIWGAICRIDTREAGALTGTLRSKLAVTPVIESIINGDAVHGKELLGMEFAVRDALRVLSSASSSQTQSALLRELFEKTSAETGIDSKTELLLEKLNTELIPEASPYQGSLSEQYELKLQRERLAKKIDSVIGAHIDKDLAANGDNLDEVELFYWESGELGNDDDDTSSSDAPDSTAPNPFNAADALTEASPNKYVFQFTDEDSSHAILADDVLSEEEIKLKEVYSNGYGGKSQESGGVRGVTLGLDDVYEDNYSKKKSSYGRGPGTNKPVKEKKYDWREKKQNQQLFSGSVHGLTRGSQRIASMTEAGKLPDIIPDGWKDMGVKKIDTFDDSPDAVW